MLVLVSLLNFLDRQILAILAERIKTDLAIGDAQLGYLYGTVFAVFFAVFGIALGRLADAWDRRRLIALGLATWSAMTVLSGFAGSFAQLAMARIGVGVGEASANPAAYSLLSDYFPRSRRATAIAVYASGIYLGAGTGMMLGGFVVGRWDAAYSAGAAPLGLRGWQVAFLLAGLPGLAVAAWVRTLREPLRGAAEGLASASATHPFREFALELCAVVPPLTLWNLTRLRGGVRALAWNVATAMAVAAAGFGLSRWLGHSPQWIALGLGLYATGSWMQTLRLRDAATFDAIFKTPSLLLIAFACAALSFGMSSFGFWMAPYLLRAHGADVATTGKVLGLLTAVGGLVGAPLGGWLADRIRRRSHAGRVWVIALTALLVAPCILGVLRAPTLRAAYARCLPVYLVGALWLGPAAAAIQDLSLPRMRASASAFFILVITFLGLALGPFTVGRISEATGDLGKALYLIPATTVVALAASLLAARRFPRDEAAVLAGARTSASGAGQAAASADAASRSFRSR